MFAGNPEDVNELDPPAHLTVMVVDSNDNDDDCNERNPRTKIEEGPWENPTNNDWDENNAADNGSAEHDEEVDNNDEYDYKKQCTIPTKCLIHL